MPKFDLFYHKVPYSIESIIKDISHNISSNNEYNPYSLERMQYYHPIYNEFFHLEENSFNKITLNHKYQFVNPEQVFDTETKEKVTQRCFIKFSPLLDPTRYMIGKFKETMDGIQKLPTLVNKSESHSNLHDIHNVSYVDNFFYYLTSQVLHNHNFLHGIDYYGSFLAVQKKFKLDISEDMEYLSNSEFFQENINKLFEINRNLTDYHNFASRGNKNKLKISNSNLHNMTVSSLPDLEIETLDNLDFDLSENIVYEKDIFQFKSLQRQNNIISSNENNSNDDESSCDSDNSEISVSSDEEDNDEDDNSNLHGSGESNDSLSSFLTSESSLEDEEQLAYIYDFPVQCICIEKCQGTFDSLFENEEMTSHQGICGLFQIIMNLICYQKCFHLTHNDLHTNNVMYIETEQKFIYYKYNKQIYKVPTYGKIYKIIDFGRSIYKFKGKTFIGNCFGPNGDASTQYNFEPYMNDKKPRIDPNFSFDLCRLGCSIYDFIIDDDENPEDFNDLQKIVQMWCQDDYGKNILYKKNGEERYPDFKLYKMIARTVHQHLPENQLKHPIFKDFEISNSQLSKNENLIDLDNLPVYVN